MSSAHYCIKKHQIASFNSALITVRYILLFLCWQDNQLKYTTTLITSPHILSPASEPRILPIFFLPSSRKFRILFPVPLTRIAPYLHSYIVCWVIF